MTTRFTLRYKNKGDVQFDNNEFEVSIAGWSQVAVGSSQAFSWNNPSSARASGAVADTHAIGASRPNDSQGWHPGDYIIDITATNTSTGGSSPLQSGVVVYPSEDGSTLGTFISFDGDGTWVVGAGAQTKRIAFTLDEFTPYLFFSFQKQGPSTGYNVVFTVDTIEIIECPTIQEIGEPGGWDEAELILERDETFHSLTERWEGGADGGFLFYGDDGEEYGGLGFIREIEDANGPDAEIFLEAEIAMDDVNFTRLYLASLDLSTIEETDDHELKVAALDAGPWPTFLNLLNSEVNLSSNVDINGIAVDPVEMVTVKLPPQPVRQRFESEATLFGFKEQTEPGFMLHEGEYLHLGFDNVSIEELKTINYNPHILSNEPPEPWLYCVYGGIYSFDIQTVCYDYDPALTFPIGEDMSDYVRFYINIDGVETEFTVGTSFEDDTVNSNGGMVYTLTLNNVTLAAGSSVRIYGRVIADLTVGGGGYSGQIRWNGAVNNLFDGVNFYNIESYANITADTIFPETTAEGYFIHDLIFGVLARLGINFYSDALGSAVTKMRQYDEDGCYWRFVALKGLQLRQYTLAEKPFFTSMKKIWDGLDPVLNLGLGYEEIDGEFVIRIEDKAHFYQGGSTSVDFAEVSGIKRIYDQDRLFKQINVGYKKWESESSSGLDDPQTKRKYKTIFKRTGKDLDIESDWIAASLTFDTTRRMTRDKSADYKYDNDIFLLAINEDQFSPESPELWEPELSENFNGITGLLNEDQRYNLAITPMRNMLRWLNVVLGGLQSNMDSEIMFSGGEGNYTMSSDYDCAGGLQCMGVICDDLAENDNIPLSVYGAGIGFLHYSKLFELKIPMDFEEYESIRAAKKIPVGISQTSSDFVEFSIKSCSYNFLGSEGTFVIWPKEEFNIQIINNDPEMDLCEPDIPDEPEPEEFDADYQAILDYANGEGYTLPSDEQQIKQNAFLLELKSLGVWDDLDVLYVFATDGDRNYAKINWKNPGSFTCTEVNTPTFTENEGFQGNGSSSYLNTGWAPNSDAVNYTLNEAGWFTYVTNEIAASSSKSAFGARNNDLSGQLGLLPKSAANLHAASVNSLNLTAGSSVSSIGFFHGRRVASNDLRLFKNGSQVGSTSTNASTGLTSEEVYVSASSNPGGTILYADTEISILGIGASLTGKESDLHDAWNTYFTSL